MTLALVWEGEGVGLSRYWHVIKCGYGAWIKFIVTDITTCVLKPLTRLWPKMFTATVESPMKGCCGGIGQGQQLRVSQWSYSITRWCTGTSGRRSMH